MTTVWRGKFRRLEKEKMEKLERFCAQLTLQRLNERMLLFHCRRTVPGGKLTLHRPARTEDTLDDLTQHFAGVLDRRDLEFIHAFNADGPVADAKERRSAEHRTERDLPARLE